MIHISTIKEMVRISPLDKLEVEKHYAYLLEQEPRFEGSIAQCIETYQLNISTPKLLLANDYYRNLIHGVYQNSFYNVQYHQALFWLKNGLTQNQILLLLAHIRMQFIVYAEALESDALASSLCHVLDVGQSIVATIFTVAESIERMKARSSQEIRRLKNSYRLAAFDLPKDILQAYIDHQTWKISAFELSLGYETDIQDFETSHLKCCLAQWLDKGGLELIPESKRRKFLSAHEQVHRLGTMAIEESKHNRPENIVELLFEMEIASEDVMEVLLNLIEQEFVAAANADSLTGFPNRRAFDLEFEKALAFAKRHDFWLDLVIVDVDFFKAVNDEHGHIVGDAVLKRVAEILEKVARTEDMLFRWGGEEFVIITLDKDSEGSEMLAERIRQAIESELFFAGTDQEMRLTVSCGALSYWAGLSLSEEEVFELADKQLYSAKQKGRNRVSHQIYDVVPIHNIKN